MQLDLPHTSPRRATPNTRMRQAAEFARLNPGSTVRTCALYLYRLHRIERALPLDEPTNAALRPFVRAVWRAHARRLMSISLLHTVHAPLACAHCNNAGELHCSPRPHTKCCPECTHGPRGSTTLSKP